MWRGGGGDEEVRKRRTGGGTGGEKGERGRSRGRKCSWEFDKTCKKTNKVVHAFIYTN